MLRPLPYTETDLRDDAQKPPGRNIDSDWLYRWRDYAGSVSSDELQSIWGRLLAGELKSPGSYSYRTLDFVRNLTTDEAKKIEQISRFVITNFISREQASLLEEDGISFADLIELQNLGVLSAVEAVGVNVTIKSTRKDRFENLLRSHGRALFVTHDDPQKRLKLKVYLVTAIGQQVLRLGKFDPHEKYLQAVGEELKKAGAVVTIGNYRAISENQFEFVEQRQI